MIPRIYNHSYTISADLVIPEGGAEGVIVAEADHLGGFSLFVEDGKLRHTYSMMGVAGVPAGVRHATAHRRGHRAPGVPRRRAASPPPAATCACSPTAQEVGKGRMDHTVPLRFSGYAGMDIGRDNGGVVDRSYADRAPFAFTGTIKKVIFDIKPHLTAERRAGAARIGAPRACGPRHQRIAPGRRGLPLLPRRLLQRVRGRTPTFSTMLTTGRPFDSRPPRPTSIRRTL